jgi:hypothetical protein
MDSSWQSFYVDKKKKPASEHPYELGSPAEILRGMGTGVFRGRKLQSGALDPDFVATTLFGDLPATPPPPALAGGYTNLNIIERIMWTMGTTLNPGPFVIAEKDLNTRKMSVSAIVSMSQGNFTEFDSSECAVTGSYVC